MRKRKHMFSVEEKKFEKKETGDFMDLGSNLHIKLFLGTAKYFRKMDKFYHEIPVACFEATIPFLARFSGKLADSCKFYRDRKKF